MINGIFGSLGLFLESCLRSLSYASLAVDVEPVHVVDYGSVSPFQNFGHFGVGVRLLPKKRVVPLDSEDPHQSKDAVDAVRSFGLARAAYLRANRHFEPLLLLVFQCQHGRTVLVDQEETLRFDLLKESEKLWSWLV